MWLEGCKFSDFKLGPILGTGSFGRVHLAHYIPTNQVCATKSLSKAMIVKSKQASFIYPISWEIFCPFLLWKSRGAMLQSNLVHDSFLTRNDIGFLSFYKVTTILYVLRGVFYSSSCPCSVRGCFVLIDRIEVNGIRNISYVEMRCRLHM